MSNVYQAQEILEGAYQLMNETDKKTLVYELSELDSQSLQHYCDQHRNVADKEELWEQLLAVRFTHLLDIVKNTTFPDLEEKERTKNRNFMPLREIYMQLLVLSADEDCRRVLETVLNNDDYTGDLRYCNQKAKETIRLYHQLTSYMLATVCPGWKKFLIAEDDVLVLHIPLSLQKMELHLLEHRNGMKLSMHIARRYFAHPDVDPSSDDDFWLINAASKGHAEMVQLLLTYPQVNPLAQNNLALNSAILKGHVETVQLLLKHTRIIPTSNDYTILSLCALAVFTGNGDMIKVFMQNKDITLETKVGAVILGIIIAMTARLACLQKHRYD